MFIVLYFSFPCARGRLMQANFSFTFQRLGLACHGGATGALRRRRSTMGTRTYLCNQMWYLHFQTMLFAVAIKFGRFIEEGFRW